MNNYFKGLLVFVIALMLFIPGSVFAEEKPYEYLNFKYERVTGENIKNTKIIIYASVEGDEKNLTDRTEEFDVVEKMWSVCTDVSCNLSEEVTDEAVWEDEKEYVFMIRITTKNGADFNVWGTDKAMLNGTPIEELDGEFGNTGNELMIKSKSTIKESPKQEETETEEEKEEEPKKEVTTSTKEKTCMLGLSLCCTAFLGLSICIWILIIILIILLIIILFALKNKKKQDNPQQSLNQ